jgi:hypothetical protein
MKIIGRANRTLDGSFMQNPEYAKDSAKALKELNALVDQGSVMSMVYLGYAHWRWIGTKKDLTPSCGG